eukprot:1664230-Rhodomonas_salina.3
MIRSGKRVRERGREGEINRGSERPGEETMAAERNGCKLMWRKMACKGAPGLTRLETSSARFCTLSLSRSSSQHRSLCMIPPACDPARPLSLTMLAML